MTCGIYLFINKVNGSKYIGQSKNIEHRKKEHIHKKSTSRIHQAIQKYGLHNFDFIILEELPYDINLLNEREQYWIQIFNTYKSKKHYNLTQGGDNTIHKIGNTHTSSTREKISQKQTGNNNSNYKGECKIIKNGFVNNKQQYCLRYHGKVIARSQSIKKLENIRDNMDWNTINNPKVSIIKNGCVKGKQCYSIYYNSTVLKSTTDKNKIAKLYNLAKEKLEKSNNKEYYKQNLDKVFPETNYYTNLNKKHKDNQNYSNQHKLNLSRKLNNSGVYHVSKEKNRYRYIYKDVYGKRRSLCCVSLNKLHEKVTNLNLEWIILDENKAKENGLIL